MSTFTDLIKSISPGLLEAGSGFLLDKLFKQGDDDVIQPLDSAAANISNFGFQGGGLSGQKVGSEFQVKSTQGRKNIVRGTAGAFNEQARQTGELRNDFGLGTSKLRESVFDRIDSNQNRTVSDLRDNLTRRKVGGSSFAADTIARTQNEFNDQRQQVGEQIGLIELEAQSQLISQEFGASVNAFNTALNELNLKGDAAIKLSTQGQVALSNIAQLKSEFLASSQGDSFARIVPGLQNAITSGFGSLFGGD